MARSRKPPIQAPEPQLMTAEIQDTIQRMGLKVMSYQDHRTQVPDKDGRTFWIPEHIAGTDLTLIVWRRGGDPKNQYGFSGWTAQIGPFTNGGMHQTLTSALAWVQRRWDVRDGKCDEFGRPMHVAGAAHA